MTPSFEQTQFTPAYFHSEPLVQTLEGKFVKASAASGMQEKQARQLLSRPLDILLSIVEARRFIESAFTDYANVLRLRWGKASPASMDQRAVDFNPDIYMELLVAEMFADPPEQTELQMATESLKLLITNGMETDSAVAVADEMIQMIANAVSTALPEITLGHNPGIEFTYIPGGDLRIRFAKLTTE